MMQFVAIGSIISAFIILAVGIFVYLYNPKNRLNIVYWMMSLMYFGWSFSLGMTEILIDQNYAVWHNRLCNICSVIGTAFYAHLMMKLVNGQGPRLKALRFIYSLTIVGVILFLLFPNAYIPEVVFKFGFMSPNVGPLFYLQMILFLSFALYGSSILVRAYLASKGIERQRLGYVILASIIGFLSGGTTYFICYNIPITMVGAPFVGFYPLIIAYAIVRHRLLDIEVVIKRSFIYSCLVIAITVLYSTTIFIGQLILQQQGGISLWLGAVISGVLVALSFRKLEDIFSRLTDRIFFKGKYDYQETLQKFSQGISSYIKLDDLVDSVSGILLYASLDI